MFATRQDRENLTHLHQRTAAAKPLNNNSLQPLKTPAPKTPFRSSRNNNENVAPLTLNKKLLSTSFVTPAPLQTRAILGQKTTNAKAQPTPGFNLNKTVQKTGTKISPRLKRGKVQIHRPETTTPTLSTISDLQPQITTNPPLSTTNDEDEFDEDGWPKEIEYCPPPRILTPPLADIDHLEPFDLSKLVVGDIFSDDEILYEDPAAKQRNVEETRRLAKSIALPKDVFPDKVENTTKSQKVPSFAAPTKSALAKHDKPDRGTIGYSRGRQVSASKRNVISEAHKASVIRPGQVKRQELLFFTRQVPEDHNADDRIEKYDEDEDEKLMRDGLLSDDVLEEFVLELE